VYAEILAEMVNKPDKAAFYVFINGHEIHEIAVRVGLEVTCRNFSRDDRVVSGTGKRYVLLDRLVDLQKSKCSVVKRRLRHTFEDAHNQMVTKHGMEFSREFDIEEMLS
jgi:predicted polyphosphate/ATP-dependent NAD kinase